MRHFFSRITTQSRYGRFRTKCRFSFVVYCCPVLLDDSVGSLPSFVSDSSRMNSRIRFSGSSIVSFSGARIICCCSLNRILPRYSQLLRLSSL